MKKLNEKGQSFEDFMNDYKVIDYDRPSNTVDIVLFRIEEQEKKDSRYSSEYEIKMLLIRRKDHPCIEQLALPGGFCEKSETVLQSARRELEEETNVANCFMKEINTYSTPERDPRTWVVSHSFLALVPPSKIEIMALDDAKDAYWATITKQKKDNKTYLIDIYIEETGEKISFEQRLNSIENGNIIEYKYNNVVLLSESNLAFDHIDIVSDAFNYLEELIMNPIYLGALLPNTFTLQTMQNVAECILGRKLIKQNFREKVLPYVEKTGIKEQNAGHRPAELYKYKGEK